MLTAWLKTPFEEKCCICFSTNHYTGYCTDRLKVSHLFPPNIDGDLLSRFMAMLKSDETYYMIFSYPSILNSIKLKPIKLTYKEKLVFANYDKFKMLDFVFVNKICVIDDIITKSINSSIFLAEHIEIKTFHMSPKELLQLLTLRTKTLSCCFPLDFKPKLAFSDIIKNAPNLEVIHLCRTDLVIDDSWPDVLLQFNKENNFKYIYLSIPDVNFNVDSLAALMKQKSVKDFVYYLYIYVPEEEYCDKIKAFEEVEEQKFSKYFGAPNSDCQKCFKLCYTTDRDGYHTLKYRNPYIYRNYGLKNSDDF